MKFLRDKLKPRLYQEKILNDCVKSNCLVVLPTGLGKTIIALMLSIHSLKDSRKVLFLAPTKPLVEQHRMTFKEYFESEENELLSVSGETSPDERKELYNKAVIIFATPQTIENDLLTRRLELNGVNLVIFDECHRGVGEYAYTFISKVYKQQNPKGKVLGLSASPGSNAEKIMEVCRNLNLNNVVNMDEDDEHVKPYVKEKEIIKIETVLPAELKKIKDKLEVVLKKKLLQLKHKGLIGTIDINKVNKRLFLGIQADLQGKLRSGGKDADVFENISLTAEVIKVLYALELLQTQGVKPLINYFQKMKQQLRVKANRSLFADADFREAVRETFDIEGVAEHPKFEKLKEIITSNLGGNAKFIVFTQYRNTGKRIVKFLKDLKNVHPVLFIGQQGKDGLTQKQQLKVVKDFDEGIFNVLVATSVAEEGLHIPSVDYAVFFEPVPSGLRMIQRRGRVGRTKVGKVLVMYTKDCIDEKYLYVSRAKEKMMKTAINNVKEVIKSRKQRRIEDF
ncbi:hypothetical protein COX58_00240 [archaeon CG_4_10_14_0_2_um_filter_Archaea_38_6]|nr:MAG: hypothetical protein COS83_02020 [archaeon CG07_land_8_20_14_0_80_38_8]PIU88425.1 MAG: hypothetical protein COS64_03680 [archaeon CG06_land_8_20_14_3_00_37_11]PJA23145.1 MAG: hypothetical protein COX58_00240 [archaeon CG_4_10_14_0_2_um_filter_Archaea_38_6]